MGHQANQDIIEKLKSLSSEIEIPKDKKEKLLGLIDTLKPSENGHNTSVERLEILLEEKSRELRQARTSLAQFDDLRNEFLSICAHDLKSPTGTILSFIEILSSEWQKLPPREVENILVRISRAGHHMMGLITDLLDMVHIESGKMQIHPKPMMLSELCRETLATMSVRFEQKEIKTILNSETGELRINMDPQKGTQIITNLLSNAIKFTPRGGEVHVTIAPENKKMKLEIRDTGQGIPEEELDKLFKQFSRTSTKATEGEAGSGLGLSIVQQLVDLHQGKIEVKSKKGVGTSFLLTFPVAENPVLMKLFSGKK